VTLEIGTSALSFQVKNLRVQPIQSLDVTCGGIPRHSPALNRHWEGERINRPLRTFRR
jgi:hypothetical protein